MQLTHNHFEPIRTVIKEEKTDRDIDFLDCWYKKDNNSVPIAYVLQPKRSILCKKFNSSIYDLDS